MGRSVIVKQTNTNGPVLKPSEKTEFGILD